MLGLVMGGMILRSKGPRGISLTFTSKKSKMGKYKSQYCGHRLISKCTMRRFFHVFISVPACFSLLSKCRLLACLRAHGLYSPVYSGSFSAEDAIAVHDVDQVLQRHDILLVQEIKFPTKADKVREERVEVALLA